MVTQKLLVVTCDGQDLGWLEDSLEGRQRRIRAVGKGLVITGHAMLSFAAMIGAEAFRTHKLTNTSWPVLSIILSRWLLPVVAVLADKRK